MYLEKSMSRVNTYMFRLGGDAIKSEIDFRKSLKDLDKPVSIICGRQDILSHCSYELKIHYPQWNLFWIQDCGHFPMYEQPEQFYSVISKVIDNDNTN